MRLSEKVVTFSVGYCVVELWLMSVNVCNLEPQLSLSMGGAGDAAILATSHSPAKKFMGQSVLGTPVATAAIAPQLFTTVTGGPPFNIPIQCDLRGKHVLNVDQFSRQFVSVSSFILYFE